MSTESEQNFRIGQYILARVRFGNINLTTIKNNSTPPLCLTPTSSLLKALDKHSWWAPCTRQHTAQPQGKDTSPPGPPPGRLIRTTALNHADGCTCCMLVDFLQGLRRKLPRCSKHSINTRGFVPVKCSVTGAQSHLALWWHSEILSWRGFPSCHTALPQSPACRIQLLEALIKPQGLSEDRGY